ncbi:SDR family oxidoreductase [Robiginitalea sp. IMCC44478]|uniref:SDR family oxidoreductase n=1 Tax=Robiginitalea sp. IMCC44478 TaxID=3459122 RepID=UPI0040435558
MQISLHNKHALIGGSSRGIGRAVACQLADSGAEVTLVARSKDQLAALTDELQTKTGRKHHFLVLDYSDHSSYAEAISAYIEKRPVDILVNNTQGPAPGTGLEKGVGDYQEAFDILFKSVVHTTLAALPNMQKKGWGRIINVASVSVKEPLGYLALSNTIRAAVVSWAKTLAADVGPFGITVNSILTGYFDTERLQQLNEKKAQQMGIAPEEVVSRMEQMVPVRRLGRPEEYGYLAAFLASEAASYLTGTAIPLDGGLLRSY